MTPATALGALLARLCPMVALVGPTGHVLAAGPTLARVLAPRDLVGARFLELFEVLRPGPVADMAGLTALEGARLRLRLRMGGSHVFKGLLCPLPGDGSLGPAGGVVLNLSFGISVVEAVRDYSLTGSDFAATDPTTEMLYLLEAKSVAMEESRRLNHRLEGARLAAQEQALTDPLTGLRNRRAFDRAFARTCEADAPFALLALDLDYFKQVNDTHGHAAGDLVLRVAAQRMLSVVRTEDIIARVGGDEFVLLLQGMENATTLNLVAERLISAIEEPVSDGVQCYRISASIGAVLRPARAPAEAEELLAVTDHALYAAKEAGRGRHVVQALPAEPRSGAAQGVATRSR
jgi:diguanylate cyclase (GGDEF)-like protein